MTDSYLPTGNDYVALPTIGTTGTIDSLNVISMADRGLLEITGNPLFEPAISIDGQPVDLGALDWTMLDHWIPRAELTFGDVTLALVYVAPEEARGFFLRVEVETQQSHDIAVSLVGAANSLVHSINESRPCDVGIAGYVSAWTGAPVIDFRAATTKLSLAVATKDGFDSQQVSEDGRFTVAKTLVTAGEGGGKRVCDIQVGVGLEEVGATTQAIHMQRRTGDLLINDLRAWLGARCKSIGDDRLDTVLNRNLFFNYFYATGRTLDTEELVLCTSRSPRYYVSAAYWDRDSLIWSFPALIEIEPARAREALDYFLNRQLRNVGIHSRYIDGTVLEPGFELDELCVPVLALARYHEVTGDADYLRRPAVADALDTILSRLEPWKHPEIDLYGTFLMPTDDMHRHPYLTYDNALLSVALDRMADIFTTLSQPERAAWTRARAKAVRDAVRMHCVAEIDGRRQFVWSTDLNGQFDVYDEPPGSLTLLAHYGFCSEDDPVFRNTLSALYDDRFPHFFAGTAFPELGCTHADHPWVLSIANSLLNGRAEIARDMLRRAPMDNSFACESIDETTGIWVTGAHFATCAGFLAYALLCAAEKDTR